MTTTRDEQAATDKAADEQAWRDIRDAIADVPGRAESGYSDRVIEAIRDAVVLRGAHDRAVRYEAWWANHRLDERVACERELTRARWDLDLSRLDRATAVLRLLAAPELRRSRTATHDERCWTRHAPCLAQRVAELLTDPLLGGES